MLENSDISSLGPLLSIYKYFSTNTTSDVYNSCNNRLLNLITMSMQSSSIDFTNSNSIFLIKLLIKTVYHFK